MGGESQSTAVVTSATEPIMASRVFNLGKEADLSDGGLTGAPGVSIPVPFLQATF